MFDDHPVRKQALLKYKNIEFTELPNWTFPKGLNQLNKMGFEIMLADHPIRKEAFPD